MAKPFNHDRPFSSLQDWMERTGTTQAKLASLAGIKPPHMSSVLKGSRRCSLAVALKLSAVTGVPVEKLVQWPKVPLVRSYNAVA
jgi:plasmid maintenance system antidote protein VapI